LAGVGTPPELVGAGGLGAVFFALPTFVSTLVVMLPAAPPPPLACGCLAPECGAFGLPPFDGVVGVGVVVLVVVVGVVEVVVVLVEVVTVGVVDVVVGVHDACTLLTGPVPGGTSDEAGVPGGAFTLKVSVWPVTSTTVTVH
jgi:hypothetical protein